MGQVPLEVRGRVGDHDDVVGMGVRVGRVADHDLPLAMPGLGLREGDHSEQRQRCCADESCAQNADAVPTATRKTWDGHNHSDVHAA